MGFFDSKLFIVFSITIFLFQSLLLYLPIVAVTDTLFPGDQINNLGDRSSSTLSSSNGEFTLGFYTIPGTFTYLGIWFTNEQESKTLWIANRDLPIDGEAILTMDDSGTVRVMNRNGATLFNVSDDKLGLGSNNNTTRRAKLLDSGNFIVYDIVTNSTIWESFDHPTDTLIPGMNLGYNLTAKKNWELTSRANDNFPTSGTFTMRLKLYKNSPQLLIYRHGELYWASGPWDERIRTFGRLYYITQSRFDLTYDPLGMYLIARLIGSGASTPTLLQLSPKGGFPDIDNSQDFCYGFYESDSGCVVSGLPQCRASASSGHDFYRWDIGPSHYFGQNSKIDDNSSISLGDCMERCWDDCDCVACSTYNDNGTGCIYGTEVEPNVVLGGVEVVLQASVYVLFKSGQYPTKSRWLLFSLAIVPVLVLAYVMVRIRILKGKENRRRDDIIHQLTGSNSFNYGDELERGIQDAPNVKIFSLKAILAATSNFSDENKLGQGGYGPVYEGKLSDGRKIAVKRLSKTSGQGILEFKSELILISKLQHTNLVRLYGCCIHQEERMLIYEFMSNKSLDFFLFGKFSLIYFSRGSLIVR